MEKWFSLPREPVSSLCYLQHLLDLPVNQSSSPMQQETTQRPGRGGRFGKLIFWLTTSISGWVGLASTKAGMMQAAGARSWDLWRWVRLKKTEGDWDSFLFDHERLIDCLIVPLEVVGVLCSKTRHTVDGREFCCEGQVYFTTPSVTTFMAFCKSK